MARGAIRMSEEAAGWAVRRGKHESWSAFFVSDRPLPRDLATSHPLLCFPPFDSLLLSIFRVAMACRQARVGGKISPTSQGHGGRWPQCVKHCDEQRCSRLMRNIVEERKKGVESCRVEAVRSCALLRGVDVRSLVLDAGKDGRLTLTLRLVFASFANCNNWALIGGFMPNGSCMEVALCKLRCGARSR